MMPFSNDTHSLSRAALVGENNQTNVFFLDTFGSSKLYWLGQMSLYL